MAANSLITEFPHLSQAATEEAWDFLNSEYPIYAQAVEKEVRAGKTAAQIGQAMELITGRPGITVRCQLAAQYLIDSVAHVNGADLPERMRP